MERSCFFTAILALTVTAGAGTAEETVSQPAPGHSLHGEAFNEGPRQQAILMAGLPQLEFPVTTTSPMAQRFISQGIAQLHGFWFLEAERSFRQAAKYDPECAMAYWGMAMANVNNKDRAKGLLSKAEPLKENLTDREKAYLHVLEHFYEDDSRDDKKRTLDCIRDFEAIVQDHPEDVEAKAFLVWKIWQGKRHAPISSPMAVNALLKEIFEKQPDHPAHHYRIHLWDGEKPSMALESAALCGPSAPAIAHMWHMPGHIYSKLKRYDDAAWQQEASSRIDHAHMAEHLLLPDQIHNYAHNEEWLVRTLNEMGRAREAIALSKSLISNPRHPTYNTMEKGSSSASYGRQRLIDTLSQWQLWEELFAFVDSPWLTEDATAAQQIRLHEALAWAHFHRDDADALQQTLIELQKVKLPQKEEVRKAVPLKKDEEKAAEDKEEAKPRKPDPRQLALRRVRVLHQALTDPEAARKALKNVPKGFDATAQVHLWLKLEAEDKALSLLERLPEHLRGQILKAELALLDERREVATTAFNAARERAYQMDPDLPAAERLRQLAAELGTEGDWQAAPPQRDDLGIRPDPETLGPLHWNPPLAPEWSARDLAAEPVQQGLFPGEPQLLLFYLGASCSHCVEQLDAFAEKAEDFAQASIRVQAIAPGKVRELRSTFEHVALKEAFPIPLLCDPSGMAFRAFRARDDFESSNLHATVLIDSEGRVRWIDVGWEPFMEVDFLLREAPRLLNLPEVGDFSGTAPVSGKLAPVSNRR